MLEDSEVKIVIIFHQF